MQKVTAGFKWVLIVTKLFIIVVNDSDAKKSACCSRVLVVTELVGSGTQCISRSMFFLSINDAVAFTTSLRKLDPILPYR